MIKKVAVVYSADLGAAGERPLFMVPVAAGFPSPAANLTAVVSTVLAGKTILTGVLFFGFRLFVRNI